MRGMFTAVCVEPCLWWAARGRGLAGRARNAPRVLGRRAAGLRSHSRPAWCEGPRAGRGQARHTAAGRDWLSGCALRRAAGCTGRALRRWSAGAMRRRDLAGKQSKAVLLPGARRQLHIRAGVLSSTANSREALALPRMDAICSRASCVGTVATVSFPPLRPRHGADGVPS